MPKIRRLALGLWVLLMLSLTGLYAVNPELLEPERARRDAASVGSAGPAGLCRPQRRAAVHAHSEYGPHHRRHATVSGSAVVRHYQLARWRRGLSGAHLLLLRVSRSRRPLRSARTRGACGGSRSRCTRKGSGSWWAGLRSRSCRPTSSATWPARCGCISGSSPAAWRWARCRSWASMWGRRHGVRRIDTAAVLKEHEERRVPVLFRRRLR